MKKYIYVLIAVLVVVGGAYWLSNTEALQGRFNQQGLRSISGPNFDVEIQKKVNFYINSLELDEEANVLVATFCAENTDDPNFNQADLYVQFAQTTTGNYATLSNFSDPINQDGCSYTLESRDITSPLHMGADGTYTFRATVDITNTYEESNERDNQLEISAEYTAS